MGKGCRAPKLATGLFFLLVGPNPAFFCVLNNLAPQGLDLAELEPLVIVQPPWLFEGVIPDLHQCELGRDAGGQCGPADCSIPVIPLGI